MARFLAIDADHGQIHLLVGNIGKSRFTIEQATTLAEEAALTPTNATEIGQRLKERLGTLGIAPAPVLFCIGRDKIILKDAKFPPVPAHEEPALVRFQTIKELAEAPDEIVIDYCHTPSAPGQFERRALAVVLRRDLYRTIQTMCEAAGLKLAAITPRAFASASAIDDAARNGAVPAPEGCVALLTRGEKWGEFSVLRGGQVVFTRALTNPALTSENALLGEVKRNITLFNGQPGQPPIQSLYIPEIAPGWSGRLREGLTIPTHNFDPLSGSAANVSPAAYGNFVALSGLVAQRSRGGEGSINFVQPREPKPPVDPNTKWVAVAAAMLAVVFLGLIAWGISVRLGKDEIIARLTQQKVQVDSELAKLEPQAKRIKAIDEWTNREIVWLDEIYELTARFPDHEKSRLIQFTGEPLPPSKNAAENKYVARMTMKVATEDGKSVDQFLAALVKDPHYRVAPKEPKGSGGSRLTRFNQQFGLRADLTHRAPNEYLSQLTTKRPSKKSGRAPMPEEPLDLGFGELEGGR